MTKAKKTTSSKRSKTSKTSKIAPNKAYKTSELKATKMPSIIEELPPPSTSQQFVMMDFEAVYSVFDALYSAFHYDTDLPEGDVDGRFVALWTLFLCSVGWNEDLFWETLDSHEHTCSECRKEQEAAEKQKTASQETGEEPKVEVIKPKMLPPGKQFN